VIELLLAVIGLNWGYVACLFAMGGFGLSVLQTRLLGQ
jgi:hypothetical protein